VRVKAKERKNERENRKGRERGKSERGNKEKECRHRK
jgi:hypothetical protein